MKFRLAVVAAFGFVSGCGGSVPDSNPNAGGGVGFGSYDSYQAQREARDLALERGTTGPISEERVIASETIGVLNATRTGTGAVATSAVTSEPLNATPIAPAAAGAAVRTAASNPGISDEQSFDAVSTRETIESDAERLRRQREAFEVVQPQAVPDRPDDTGPNIVAYALSTSNMVGQQVYRRSGTVSDSAYQRACARFTTSDQAQEAFLEAGGPRNDRRGLDPDGDGFACFWDPTPFRAARGG